MAQAALDDYSRRIEALKARLKSSERLTASEYLSHLQQVENAGKIAGNLCGWSRDQREMVADRITASRAIVDRVVGRMRMAARRDA